MADSTPRPDDRLILAAIDFSPSSAEALLWAARAAQQTGSRLVALHVVHDPGATPGYYQRAKKHKKHLQRIEVAAESLMTEFLSRLKAEHPKLLADLETRMVIGIPVTRVLEVAERLGAQQIVVGSLGRTGIESLLLGSKALRIAQLSPIPVTIVKLRRPESKNSA